MSERLSSSEQYAKKSNRRLLLMGLGLLVLFIVALVLMSGGEKKVQQPSGIDWNSNDFDKAALGDSAGIGFARGTAELAALPPEVIMDGVVLGAQAESIVTLTAKNAPIEFIGLEMEDSEEGGFVFGGTCTPNLKLAENASCTVRVSWNPTSLRQIQNTLNIRWREDNPAVIRANTLALQLRAQSTDSKDCVICETPCKDEDAVEKKMAMGLDGTLHEVDDEGYVTIDGKRYKVTENGLIIDENGNIIGIVVPDKIPMSLDNKVMGTISKTRDVLAADGTGLGRLLGDDTIADSSLKILGAAVPVVSVMDSKGRVIGKTLPDGTVIDGTNTVVGRPLVDGSVVNLDGSVIGSLRPWGLVINFTGDIIGGVLPDGSIGNAKNQIIGSVKPTGLAVDPQGELIGGVIPQGVAVGASCKALGSIALNGQVKDSFGQIIGKVLLDGSIVDDKMNELGSAVSQGLVINEKGDVMGFVNSEGKAVNGSGQVIGCVNPDGSVMAGNKPVGAVMAKGRVIGRGCGVIGSVYPDGSVMNAAVEAIGRVRADAYVANANNRLIGVVIPKGTAVAEGCRLLGLITLDGQVVDTTGVSVGCVTMEKQVVNRQQEVIGAVAMKGQVVDASGKVIGRVRLDGKVMDASGKVIGCVNPDGTVTALDGKTVIGSVVANEGGVVLDENGNLTGWTVVGNEVFDANGNKVGDLQPNGWVTNEKGEIIGVIPPDGVIFSNDGLILGRYTRKTGVAADLAGERIGVVLPDFTVLNVEKTEIIGALIADKTPFMDMAGQYLATMNAEGLLIGSAGETVGAIKADGSVIDKNAQTIGVRIPQGKVFSTIGQELGTVNEKGQVLSPAQTVIGRMLPNGLAISKDDVVLGAIFPDISLPIGPSGVIGAMTYQGTVNDVKGRKIGVVSPFGTIIGNKNEILGRLVRIGPYVDLSGKLMGWASFKGELNDKTGGSVGTLSMAGLAFDADNVVLGSLIPRGVVVSDNGTYIGPVAPNAQVLGTSGQSLGQMNASGFMAGGQSGVMGRLLVPGIAVDADGNVIGWTRYDGAVEKGKAIVGRVALDGNVFDVKGNVVGTYVPLGTAAVTELSDPMGVVDGSGRVVNAQGQTQGLVMNHTFVINDGNVVGRLMSTSPVVNDAVTGRIIGMAGVGAVTNVNDNKPLGTVMANGLVVDLTKKVVGGLVPEGLPITTRLTVMGRGIVSGQTVVDGKIGGYALGTQTGVVYNTDNAISGAILPAGTFIDRNGAVIGRSSGTALIVDKNGKKLAEYMAFGSALTLDTKWAGGIMPMGVAINDDGYHIGAVVADGMIVGKDGVLMGRIMTDGTAVGMADRTVFTTMPYAGHTVKQGLPFSYKNFVLGRTTVSGDILDATDKKAYRMLDDGTILGKEMPLDGAVLSFNPATGHEGEVLGGLDGAGKVVSVTGKDVGTIAVNGSVKGNHKLKILGALVPEPLIVNDCKMVGQTSYNGQVIDGRGNIVGRITPDKWAVNTSGEKIGRAVRNGAVLSPTGDFLGRTLPDSTVVDTQGANLGCARNDGSVVDNAGNVIGHVLERGLVLDKDGNPIGRVKFDGTVVNKDGVAIGKVLGDGKGTVVDFDGNVIGRVVSPDEELMFNEDGTIAGTFGRNGLYKSPDGTPQFQVLPNGDIIDPVTGRKIATLTDDGRLLDMNGNEISDIRVLRDADGNFIGLVDDKGNILNFDGQKIGQVMPDGRIVDNNGDVIGQIHPDGTISWDNTECKNAQYNGEVRDDKGNLLYTIKCGKVYDKDGKLIGTIDADGNMFDLDGNYMGRIDKNGNVYDKNGKLIGKFKPTGTQDTECENAQYNGEVYDKNGELLYRIECGKVYDKNGKLIGTIDANGNMYGLDGKYMGRIDENGNVYDKNGKLIGKLKSNSSGVSCPNAQYNGDVHDKNGNLLYTIKCGKIYDKYGNLIGTIDANGNMYDLDGKYMGRIDKDGNVYDKYGKLIGKFKSNSSGVSCPNAQYNGDVHDKNGNLLYTIKCGKIYDKYGNLIGTIDANGNMYDLSGNYMGRIDKDGNVYDKYGKLIGKFTASSGSDSCQNYQYNGKVKIKKDGIFKRIWYRIKCGKVYDPEGKLVGTIDNKGEVRGLNDEPIFPVTPGGESNDPTTGETTVHEPEPETNNEDDRKGTHGGTDTKFKDIITEEPPSTPGAVEPGAFGAGSSGRRIFVGDKVFEITPKGSLIDSTGTVVGYMGDDGRPYSLDNHLLVGGGDAQGRTRPNLDQKVEKHPEQMAQMQQLLAQRRQQMREKMKNFSRIKPDGRTLARAKKKEDPDWGEEKIVSTYPVDMSRMILKDKAIPAVLVHSIDSRYTNIPVTAIVERHIYAEQGRNIIIPAGSRVIGKASGSGGENHVAKLEISWERLIRPDGSAFKFSAQSGDAQGRGGVAAYLDEQMIVKYGKPVMTSLLTSATAYISATNNDITTKDNGDQVQSDRSQAASDARTSFIDAMNGVFEQLLEEATSIKPIVWVPAGTRLTIFSNADLWLRTEVEDEQDYDAAFGGQSSQAQGTSGGNWIENRSGELKEAAENGEIGAVGGEAVEVGAEDGEYYEPENVSVDPIYGAEIIGPEGRGAEVAVEEAPEEPAAISERPNLDRQMIQPIMPTQKSSARMF